MMLAEIILNAVQRCRFIDSGIKGHEMMQLMCYYFLLDFI